MGKYPLAGNTPKPMELLNNDHPKSSWRIAKRNRECLAILTYLCMMLRGVGSRICHFMGWERWVAVQENCYVECGT